jgi:hypothetical protein
VEEEEEEKMITFVDLLAIVAFCLPDSKKFRRYSSKGYATLYL